MQVVRQTRQRVRRQLQMYRLGNTSGHELMLSTGTLLPSSQPFVVRHMLRINLQNGLSK